MLSCKKISAVIIASAFLYGCMEQKLLFDFNRDVNASFFKEVPGIGSDKYFGNSITKKADKAEIYTSSFREKFIEKDNLLEYTELNDDSKITSAPYWEVGGYSQNLYLLKYQFTYTVIEKEKSFDIPVEATVSVPTGYCEFPREILRPPRSVAERTFTNLQRWSVMERGGHFAAMEQPDALAREVREFFRPLR